MKLVLLGIALLGIGVFGMAVKIIFKKGGRFDKTCASSNSMFNKDGEPCGFCGAMPEEKCKSDEVES